MGGVLNLILDYTETAKRYMEAVPKENQDPGQLTTVLMLDYPNGEHCSTFPEITEAGPARKRAQTFKKYCDCCFIDKTKD